MPCSHPATLAVSLSRYHRRVCEGMFATHMDSKGGYDCLSNNLMHEVFP